MRGKTFVNISFLKYYAAHNNFNPDVSQIDTARPWKAVRLGRTREISRLACIIHESLEFMNKHPQQIENLDCGFRQGAFAPAQG